MPTIAVLGTFDTKGPEHAFLAEAIRAAGGETLLIDVGCHGPATLAPDVGADIVAAAAGPDWQAVLARRDRGESVAWMGRGAAKVVTDLAREGRINGIVSLGGGGGTAIGTTAMRALPLGFPKLMVSTLASGQTAAYVGTSDLVMMPAIVDVAGLNRISRGVFTRAAGAITGLVRAAAIRPDATPDRPIIAASMFGNTTACVGAARRHLEEAGYEVLVYHATGTGGRSMEALIASGFVSAVLDVTTTEWADEHVGGILGAGPDRLAAAGRAGLPTVVAPGCLDMVNFGEPASVPARFAGRSFYQHNPQVTLMRTSPEECAAIGRIIAEKLNRYTGPVSVLLPLRGISVISAPGQPFHDPVADAALFDALRTHLRPAIPVLPLDLNINDAAFAAACAAELLRLTRLR